jgi:TPP-dependent indolepyruvate ferredoxin oxidoreductase alpha subunit
MKVKAGEAIGMAMHAAGAKVATCVPGLGATEIFSNFCSQIFQEPIFSFHEEVAYTVAHGAALAGQRSFTSLKTHGFIKAGNSVTDSLYSGTVAGFVCVIVDDCQGIQSDSIVDTEAFVRGIGIPHKVADVENVHRDVLEGFELSERLRLPFALIIDASDLERSSVVSALPKFGTILNQHRGEVTQHKDVTQHVLCPPFCRYQREVLRCKNRGCDWTSIQKPALLTVPESLPERWKPVAKKYARLFEAFKSAKGPIAAGDTGISTLFALPPYNCIDVTTYMGGSVPLAIGAYLSGCRPAWAVTGDFSFIAAGHLGLIEAALRHIPLKVLVLYNGKAETTGGQRIPDGFLERVVKGYKDHVVCIHDPQDKNEIEDVLGKAARSDELCLVIADFR